MTIVFVVLLVIVFFLAWTVFALLVELGHEPWGAEATARRAIRRRKSTLMAQLMNMGMDEDDAWSVARSQLNKESVGAAEAYIAARQASGDA